MSRGLNDTWSIGPGSAGTVFGGESARIASVAIWSELLTDAELLETYLRHRTCLNAAGITVL